METDNKQRKTTCLNCIFSYRGKDKILHCERGHMTSVTFYDCNEYEVFVDDKEDLTKLYKALKLKS